MITNIIKGLIKDIPSLANAKLELVYHDKDNNQFAVKADKVTIAVNAPHERTTYKPAEWKANMVTDHIYAAATIEDKPTLKELSDTIDDIISTFVVVWNIAE